MDVKLSKNLILRILMFCCIAVFIFWDYGSNSGFIPRFFNRLQKQPGTPATATPTSGDQEANPPGLATVSSTPGPETDRKDTSTESAPYVMVYTEVLDQIGATEYHAHGFLGQNVRVAIIDTQFDGYTDRIDVGELPSNTITISFDEDGELSNNLVLGKGSHGTACAEIVHDVAPEAQLVLVQTEDFGGNLAFILEYLQSINTDIISLSVSVLGSRELFQNIEGSKSQDPMYALLRDAVQEKDMFIVVSAGNYARQHYQGMFTDTNWNLWHEFTEVDAPESSSESVSFNLGKDKTIEVSLSWNQNKAAFTESREGAIYTLFIFNSSGEEMGRSTRFFIDDGSQFTSLSFTSDIEDTYSIKIQKEGVSEHASLLNLFIKGETVPLNQYQVAWNSLAVPADSPDVFTVGSADALNFTLDSTSSRGVPGGAIVKPDATSFAHVSISSPGYGTRGFSGTSSAAPHVAGMAALILGQPQNRQLKPDELEKHLLSFVEDKGVPGSDTVWGAGLIRLPPLKTNCEILIPTTKSPITLDSGDRKFQVTLSITRSNNQPVYGLNPAAFQVTVGNVQAEIMTLRSINDKLIFEILSPLLPSGKYDLRVKALDTVCVHSQAVVYATITNPNESLEQYPDFHVSYSPLNPTVGSLIWFLAALSDTNPISGALVKMDITHPDGHTTHYRLFDDGMHTDGTAADGVYGCAFAHTLDPGRYQVHLTISGTSSLGKLYQLTHAAVFWVDPETSDYDNDGMPDVWERTIGLNEQLNDAYNDPDGDGLLNMDEYLNGAHPFNWDTDEDTLSDLSEVAGYYATNPNSIDSDSGGISDADELAQNSNPLDHTDDFIQFGLTYLPKRLRAFIPAYKPPDRTITTDTGLWIATNYGLIQWDLGTHTYKKYTVYHGLLDNSIDAMGVHTSGDLWLGSEKGLSIVHQDMHDQQITITPHQTVTPSPTLIKAIAAQENGNMWVGSEHGVSVHDGKIWRTFTELNNIKLHNVQALAITDLNTLWIGMRYGLLKTTISEQSNLILVDDHPIDALDDNPWITGILMDKKKNLWISTWGDGVSVLTHDQWTTYKKDDGLADDYVQRITPDDEGTVWVVTEQSLNRYDTSIAGGRWMTYINRESHTYGLPDGNINTFYTKQNGRIQVVPYSKYPIPASLVLSWSSTQPSFWGLTQSSTVNNTPPYRWQLFESAEPSSHILSTAVLPDGEVWFGLHNGIIIYEQANERWRIPGFNHEIPQVQINTIEHTLNSTWVGTDGFGLLEFDGNQWQHYSRADGLGSLFVHSTGTDALGRLWVGSGAGLGGISYRQDDDWYNRDQRGVLSTDYIYAIAKSGDGSLWFGTHRGLLVKEGDTILDRVDIEQLAGQYIWAIAVNGNNVWLGTNSGVFQWDGTNWHSYTTLDGLSNNQVWDIAVDEKERVWVATSDGLNMFDAGTWESFSLSDKQNINHIWDIAIQPGDTSIWLTTEGGILSFALTP